MTGSGRPLLTITAIVVLSLVAMVVIGMDPDLLLAGTLLGALAVGAWVLAHAADSVPDPGGPRRPVAGARSPLPEGHDRRVKQVRTGLAYGRTDGLSRERLHASLVAIVDDQLRVVHEIDRRTDPAAARAVLGPELTAFVDAAEPPTALGRPRDLDRLLTRIEQL